MGRSNRAGRGLSFRRNVYVNPPQDTTWVWETREMLENPAYHARSINARRLWDALRLEHLRNGALENGGLVMPYNELQRVHGCSRGLIRDAIDELVALGFLAEGEPKPVNGNHRPANTYRLTFLGTGRAAPPTNEWKRFNGASRDFVEMAKRAARERRQQLRRKQSEARQRARRSNSELGAVEDGASAGKVVPLDRRSQRQQ